MISLADCRSVDLAELTRRGLQHGRVVLTWSGAGRATAEIEAKADNLGLRLVFQAGGALSTHHIAWSYSDTAFGGRRRWLSCPRCTRACRVLYDGGGGRFLCRVCLGAGYASQGEPGHLRALGMLQRIRRRLGGSASLVEPFPAKPPRMHWGTYQALRARCRRLEHRYIGGFAGLRG